MLYLVYSSYKPNQAPTNRVLAVLKGLDELGVKATFVLLYPNDSCDRLNSCLYNNIRVQYLWEKRRFRNKIYRFLSSFIDARCFARSLNSGDSVILFGCSSYVPFFTAIDGIRVYQERTEHPQVNPAEFPFLQKSYLRQIPRLDGMFVISTELKRVMEGYGAKNVHIINMLADSSRFDGVQRTTEDKYVAYCGTASNNKDGVDDLIKAFAIVVKRFPELKLIIMGKAPSKDDESGNLALVDNLGIKDKVIFTGVIKAKDMPQMLKNATVVALARPDSLQARCGFPTKLGEYLLTGNPVVITKVGDIPIFLEDGKTALLAEQRNPKGFADKILWVLDHPDEARNIGLAGRKVALAEFNYRREAEKILDIIKDKR